MEDHMLTTTDNPYNPFTQFEQWNAFDMQKGYHTLSYLARIAIVSEELPESDTDAAIEDAMDEIVRFNLTGNYRKVSRKDFENVENKK